MWHAWESREVVTLLEQKPVERDNYEYLFIDGKIILK
jgi:hypothetical protein